MIEIKLKHGQSGYDAVGACIQRYWDHNREDTVIVSVGISHDGKTYERRNEVASPCNGDIEFLYDWWEGEQFLRVYGIVTIDDLKIIGGLC